MKSQNLTPDQYRRTNRIMYIILIMSYTAFIGIECSNITKNTSAAGGELRSVLYAALIIVLGVVVKLKGNQKIAMVIMAISYLIAYPMVAFGNGA